MRKMLKSLVLGLVSIIGLSSSVFGGTITKTYEIGEGTSQPFSHKRTFEVPCQLEVSVIVTFSRLGRPGAENDVPLTITLMNPAADGGEGEVVAEKDVKATTNYNYTSLNGPFSGFGCSKPWSVRVKSNRENPNFTVKGEIRFSFPDQLRTLDIGSRFSIERNQSNDYLIPFFPIREYSYSNSQGVIEIKGTWYHDLNLMPIKFKIELINPREEIVAHATGFAQNEVNPCCSGQKLKLTYRIPEFIPGQWKVRIRNISDHKAVNINPVVTFKPSCP